MAFEGIRREQPGCRLGKIIDMGSPVVFLFVCRLIGLLTLGPKQDDKDIEIAVLRHQLSVLRRQVPMWLRSPQLRDFVVGFSDAHVGHGGEGALYVRLRRPRGKREQAL